jgi:hypothetical protein
VSLRAVPLFLAVVQTALALVPAGSHLLGAMLIDVTGHAGLSSRTWTWTWTRPPTQVARCSTWAWPTAARPG